MRKRSKKSSRVTWAPDVNLCQVRLFLSDSFPSEVGFYNDDHFQAKTSWLLHTNDVEFDDLPPGFEGFRYSDPFRKEQYHVPQVKWKCPPRFLLNDNWHVATGEESEECEAQRLREMGILEAIYPRPSAIPPSPSISLDVEECDFDDRHTPVIPITPIEEEDAMDMSCNVEPLPPKVSLKLTSRQLDALSTVTPNTAEVDLPPVADKKRPPGLLAGLEADVVAAASAAFTALLKSNEQGSMIDTDLLIKILSEPKLIELVKTFGSFESAKPLPTPTEYMPASLSKPAVPEPRVAHEKEYFISSTLPISEPKRTSSLTIAEHPTVVSQKPTNNESMKPSTASNPTSNALPVPAKMEAVPSVPFSQDPYKVLSQKPVNETLEMLLKTLQAPKGMNTVLSMLASVAESDKVLAVKSENLVLEPGISSSMPVSKPASPKLTRESVYALPRKPDSSRIAPILMQAKLFPSPTSVSKLAASFGPLSPKGLDASSLTRSANGRVQAMPRLRLHSLHSLPSQESSFLTMKAPVVKDANYYKSLVKQHGTERQETRQQCFDGQSRGCSELALNSIQGDVKAKIQKPCIYFHSTKGCWNGSNCPYQHDLTLQLRAGSIPEAHSTKRMKITREITGRMLI
ncbi:hypothetical protein Ancab_026576 [Ancistrocladus abbreviatus]